MFKLIFDKVNDGNRKLIIKKIDVDMNKDLVLNMEL
jgi:hypothetical protein